MKPLIVLDELLLPPELPQSVNGVIDIKSLPQNVIVVVVEPYYNISTGDRITVIFGTIASVPYIVVDGPTQGPMQFAFYTDNIPNGNYRVLYTAIDTSGNFSYSPFTPILVINSSCNLYPAPTFPDYPYNIIGIQSVIEDYGATIRAAYSKIATGDIVTFFWQGMDAYENDVPQSHFTKQVTVTPKNVNDAYIEVQIPAANILCLGNFGSGHAYYTVSLQGYGGNYTSSTTNASIIWGDINQLQISLGCGAPPRSLTEAPYLTPSNSGSVFGPPGASVKIMASNGAVVMDQYGVTNIGFMNLDENGLGSFTVYTTSLNADDQHVYVSAQSTTGSLPHAIRGVMQFGSYRRGMAGIKAYGIATNITADGISPCSIYLLAEAGVTTIDVFGDGDFLINGRSNCIITTLNSDNTATINVTSDFSQSVTLSIRDSCNRSDVLCVEIDFVKQLGFN